MTEAELILQKAARMNDPECVLELERIKHALAITTSAREVRRYKARFEIISARLREIRGLPDEEVAA